MQQSVYILNNILQGHKPESRNCLQQAEPEVDDRNRKQREGWTSDGGGNIAASNRWSNLLPSAKFDWAKRATLCGWKQGFRGKTEMLLYGTTTNPMSTSKTHAATLCGGWLVLGGGMPVINRSKTNVVKRCATSFSTNIHTHVHHHHHQHNGSLTPSIARSYFRFQT